MKDITEYLSPELRAKLPITDAENDLYAGFWRRFAACFLDLVFLNIMFILFELFLDMSGSFYGGVTLVHFVLGHASKEQATLGKMALGIMVVSAQGKRISFLHALGRYFLWGLCTLFTLGINLIMVGRTPKKQALHDIIGKTFVVNKKAFEKRRRKSAPAAG